MDYPKSVPNVGLVGGKFVDENLATGAAGSLIPAAWGNAVTTEILNVIAAGGLAAAEADLSQLLQAIRTIRQTNLTTPPQFDNGKNAATTEFVQRALGNFAYSQVLSSSTVLNAGYAGQNIWLAGTSNYTITLPSVSTLTTGAVLYLWSSNPGTVTINRAGTDNILVKSTSVTTFTIGEGDSLYLVANPAIGWIAFGGTRQLAYSSVFSSSSSPSGFQRLPGGLIECRGTFTSSSTAGGPTSVTFPYAFTTLHSLVITPNSASTTSVSAWFDSGSGSGFNGHCNLSSTVCNYIAKGV
ncbi:gp53-like domain-containing protein [Pseudomonas sp. 22189]|uniref:gp53-like domain-containing protein n=1 Tax=Pseudomonas sp. 22189 TaxID=3453889 RepID=UPI003F8645BA